MFHSGNLISIPPEQEDENCPASKRNSNSLAECAAIMRETRIFTGDIGVYHYRPLNRFPGPYMPMEQEHKHLCVESWGPVERFDTYHHPDISVLHVRQCRTLRD